MRRPREWFRDGMLFTAFILLPWYLARPPRWYDRLMDKLLLLGVRVGEWFLRHAGEE